MITKLKLEVSKNSLLKLENKAFCKHIIDINCVKCLFREIFRDFNIQNKTNNMIETTQNGYFCKYCRIYLSGKVESKINHHINTISHKSHSIHEEKSKSVLFEKNKEYKNANNNLEKNKENNNYLSENEISSDYSLKNISESIKFNGKGIINEKVLISKIENILDDFQKKLCTKIPETFQIFKS